MMILIICAFLLACLYFGLKHSGQVGTLQEFALGYKKISTAALVTTMYATHLGAGATLGLIEQINNIGVVCAIIAIACVSNWYISRAICCINLDRFEGCLSQSHLMEKLYGKAGLWVSNITNIIKSTGVVAIQIVVIGFVIQYFSTLSPTIGIILGAGAVTLYAASGGVKAVIITDLLQAIVFGIVIITVFFLSVQNVTTQPNFLHHIPASKLWIIPHDWHSALLLIGMIVYAFTPIGYDAPFIQRILMSGSEKQLRKAFSYLTFMDLAVALIISAIAILILPITGEGNLTKVGIFELVNNTMHPIIVTLIVIGILAVTMSTADSWLNAAAVIIAHDIAKQYKPDMTDGQAVTIARISTLIMGILAAGLALFKGSILSLLLLGENFYWPIMLVPMLAGFLGYNCTVQDFKRSIIYALIGVFLGRYTEGEFAFISLLFGIMGSTVGLTLHNKWSFRLPNGNPILKFPGYRQVTPGFLALIIMLASIYAFAHLYIDQAWLIGDLLLAGCMCTALLGLLLWTYGETESNLYKFCPPISTTFLIASMSTFAFRTGDQFSLLYLIFSITTVLAYSQYWATLCGIMIGVSALKFWHVMVYTPLMPLSSILVGFLVLAAFFSYIYLKDTKEQLEEEKMLSLTDALTGLYNRRYLDLKVESMVRRAHKRAKHLAIIMFDIDKFGQFNNTYGHKAGDAVLRQLGVLVKQNARSIDECMRYGGEEFIIAMPDTNMEQAVAMAERLRELVAHTPLDISGPNRAHCTISIGVAALKHGDTASSLIARADSALYTAKNKGRNNVATSDELQHHLVANPAVV